MACPKWAFGCFLHAIVHLVLSVVGQGTSNATLTWSMVLQQSTNTPTGCVSCKLSFNSFSSRSEGPRLSSYQRGEKACHSRKSPKEMQPPPDPHLWLTHRGLGRQGLNAGSMGGDGQDVELVVNDETLLTRGQRKNKSEEQNHHTEVLGRRQGLHNKGVAFFRKIWLSEAARESHTRSERT